MAQFLSVASKTSHIADYFANTCIRFKFQARETWKIKIASGKAIYVHQGEVETQATTVQQSTVTKAQAATAQQSTVAPSNNTSASTPIRRWKKPVD